MFKTVTTVCALFAFVMIAAQGLKTAFDYSDVYRSGYAKGRADAAAELHREAVRTGHGHWEAGVPGQPNRFAWNSVLHQYNPDRARNSTDDATGPAELADSASQIMQLLQ